MFTANGRTGRKTTEEVASIKGKEFICANCGKRKRILNVEFGEQILCVCGKPMAESYEE